MGGSLLFVSEKPGVVQCTMRRKGSKSHTTRAKTAQRVKRGKQLVFLFGKERDCDANPGWSDFGGGTDSGESFLVTAIREGSEELTGFLGSEQNVRAYIRAAIKHSKTHELYTIQYLPREPKYSTYCVHIIPVPYQDFAMLAQYYNNNQAFLQKRLSAQLIRDSKIFEKQEIRWFTWSEMARRRHEFRVFYRDIIDLLLAQRKRIEVYARQVLMLS